MVPLPGLLRSGTLLQVFFLFIFMLFRVEFNFKVFEFNSFPIEYNMIERFWVVIDSCFNSYMNPRWDLLSTFFISSLTDQSPGPKRGLVVMRRWMEALALSHPVCLVVLPCLAAVDLVHPSIGRYQTKCFVCSFNSAKAGLLDCRARIQSWGVLDVSLRTSCAQLNWWSQLTGHLSSISPSRVSFSTMDGGTFGGPQFFSFSSAKSHENCLHFKVVPVINDKKTFKAPCCDRSSACNTMNLRSTELSPQILVLVETIKERCGVRGQGGNKQKHHRH